MGLTNSDAKDSSLRDFKAESKSESDETQAKIDSTNTKLDSLIANQTNGTQITQIVNSTGTWANGVETAVAGTAVQIQAVNASRKKLIIQNVGVANARIGISGVTATTGTRLVPGGVMILETPFIETNAIFAIREGGASTTILTQETT